NFRRLHHSGSRGLDASRDLGDQGVVVQFAPASDTPPSLRATEREVLRYAQGTTGRLRFPKFPIPIRKHRVFRWLGAITRYRETEPGVLGGTACPRRQSRVPT